MILYSGPRTWAGVDICTGKSTKKVDQEKTCGIRMVSHFTQDLKKLKQKILGLEWPKGSTLTSLALMTAKAELSLGRKDAASNVIIFTDGRPLSFRKTGLAANAVQVCTPSLGAYHEVCAAEVNQEVGHATLAGEHRECEGIQGLGQSRCDHTHHREHLPR